MDQDVKRIIEMIDVKIRTLQQTKRVLLNEFSEQKETATEATPLFAPLENFPGETLKKETRREAVKRVLKEHGPMKTNDIQKQSGIPRGSLNWVLREKETFARLADGRWTLIEQTK